VARDVVVRVRRASVGDAGDLAVVHVDSWRAAYRDVVPRSVLDELSVDGRVDAWARQLADDGDRIWTTVAEVESGVVGFCRLAAPSRDADAEPRTGEIAALYVAPGIWRRGVGRELIRSGLDELGGVGYEEVTVWVLGGNAAGESFYRCFGFARDGAEKVHERSGVTELRLRRPRGGRTT
jgi:predicted N-acetyltransferase YhbS